MVVQDHDGGHHAARHHEHDAVEVGPCCSVRDVVDVVKAGGSPISGESEVMGMISDTCGTPAHHSRLAVIIVINTVSLTVLRNIVSESKMVTPEYLLNTVSSH